MRDTMDAYQTEETEMERMNELINKSNELNEKIAQINWELYFNDNDVLFAESEKLMDELRAVQHEIEQNIKNNEEERHARWVADGCPDYGDN
jgi:cell division septal protein FtsQ